MYQKHSKQRLVYYELKKFLENPPEGCRIAVLTGIRRIGKTGILTDICASLPNTLYVNFGRNSDIKAETKSCLEFLHSGNGILLIDEISHFPNYETLVETIEQVVYRGDLDLKVVLTGSSALHISALKSGILGAGRAKVFRLSFLSFAEYLVFTGKKTGYKFSNSTDITEADFKDYLQLKNLPAEGLKITFNREYMADLYRDIDHSNNSSRNPGAFSEITSDDILCVLDLVAYTLGNTTSWGVFRNPDGIRELAPLGVADIEIKGLRIHLSADQLKNVLTPKNIARALYYLIVSNLAYVEVKYDDPNKMSASKLADKLFDIKTGEELLQVFSKHNICLVNPIWYVRIAQEIVEAHGLSVSELFETHSFGSVLENYVKGSYCRWQSHQYEYEISEIGSKKGMRTNEERSQSKEVDICDVHRKLLCEITKGSNKRSKQIHLMEHFQKDRFIRILTTKDVDKFTQNTYKIPYPKLCAMVDTGEVFALDRTIYEDSALGSGVKG